MLQSLALAPVSGVKIVAGSLPQHDKNMLYRPHFVGVGTTCLGEEKEEELYKSPLGDFIQYIG
jgi:hypothetical protein